MVPAPHFAGLSFRGLVRRAILHLIRRSGQDDLAEAVAPILATKSDQELLCWYHRLRELERSELYTASFAAEA